MAGTSRQMSVDELREQISQRLRSNAAFSKTVYQEQPIIMTASQLKGFVPDAIREARQLARTLYAQGMGVAEVFHAQARMLAGYEDDFEFTGSFSQYYPSYEDMSNEQLRGYFAWRTKVRRGNVEQGSLSFAYVYLYELINLVGVSDARGGYDALLSFGSAYRRYDARFGKLFDQWVDDFVIYYDLDASLLSTASFAQNDAAFDVLLHYDERTPGELFDALVNLSSYRIEDSPFFVEHEAELRNLIAGAYLVAARHHDAKLKTTLAEKLVGRPGKERLWLFERAIFADPLAIESRRYPISEHDTVFCRNGAWFRARYARLEHPIPWISQLLETCESILRDAYEFPNTLECGITTRYLVKSIEGQAARMAEEARLREERAVRIDFGKLERIRSAADETCEKLIVEEEEPTVSAFDSTAGTPCGYLRDSPAQGCPDGPAEATDENASAALPKKANGDDLPLDARESALLVHLLSGGAVREFERSHACIASVLMDSINERLYDEFADICIDTGGDEPVIIEDYVDELRALLGMD